MNGPAGPAAAGVSTGAPANFDRLAGIYRWMEWASFGPWLGRCRRAFLPEMATARRALVLGDGDGRFTAALLAANPAVVVDAVDASPAMLHALEQRSGSHAARLRTLVADARRWTPQAAGYDLVATHFFLDCLTTDEVKALAARIRPELASEAAWVISEFAEPPKPIRAAAGAATHRFPLSCLPVDDRPESAPAPRAWPGADESWPDIALAKDLDGRPAGSGTVGYPAALVGGLERDTV